MPHIVIKPEDMMFLGWLNELPEISIADLRTVLRLDEEMAAGGGKTPLTVLANEPVQVGGIRLYRPTMGAIEAAQRCGNWFGEDAASRILLDAWILAHARQPQRLCRLVAEPQASRILADWRPQLGIGLEELAVAVLAAWEGFPAPDCLSKASPLGTLAWAARMVEQFGADVDTWVWDISAQKALWLSRELADANAEKHHTRPGYRAAMGRLRQMRAELRARYASVPLDPVGEEVSHV